ncbi:hypothetical protein ABZ468_24620 [Streptomyces sp. NPDC005708]|uniref:hypothetical protein n=1 Tax=unclassified Streptomyces TaxID=2593676 RepID=UPI00340E228D
MPRPHRRLAVGSIGVVAVCLLASGATALEPSSDAGGPSPAMGPYLNYSSDGVGLMTEFQQWLGGADVKVGHTYLPGDRWSNIEGKPYFLEAWAQWPRERPDRVFVLNVSMLERNEDHLSAQEVRGLLAQGAEGAFDHHFRVICRHPGTGLCALEHGRLDGNPAVAELLGLMSGHGELTSLVRRIGRAATRS